MLNGNIYTEKQENSLEALGAFSQRYGNMYVHEQD
jgi:hypothetical protein